MNILILGINFAPEIISTGAYTTGMAKFLAAQGHKVDVITAHPYYPEWRLRQGWPRLKYVKDAPDPKFERLNVIHCPLYVPRHPTGLRRILHHASFALTAFIPAVANSFSKGRSDVVIVIAPSLLSAVSACIAARIAGSKTWLHIQDFEVEAAIATGLLKKRGRITQLALAFEQFILKRFDRVSSISSAMLTKLSLKGLAKERIVELRNWADLDLVAPGPIDERMRDMLGGTTQHVALYSGNLANKQGLEIIPAAAKLLSHRDDITFLICGNGPMLEPLREACRDLPQVKFAPLQPRERLGALMSAADIHLLPQIAGAADLVLPSKLKNMLASGRPIVATAQIGTALAIEIGEAGILTEPGDPLAFAEGIRRLVDAPNHRLKMGERGRAIAESRWSPSEILVKFEQQLRELTTTNIVQKVAVE